MKNTYDVQTPKKMANLSLNNQPLTETLEKETNTRLKDRWQEQNAKALAASNELTERYGLFSNSYRIFRCLKRFSRNNDLSTTAAYLYQQ